MDQEERGKRDSAQVDVSGLSRLPRLFIPLEVVRYMALSQKTIEEVHLKNQDCDLPPLMLQIPLQVFTEPSEDQRRHGPPGYLFDGPSETVQLNIILRPHALPDVSGLEQHFRSALRGLIDQIEAIKEGGA